MVSSLVNVYVCNHIFLRDFNKLVWTAFSSLRRRASLLVSALLFLASQLNLQVETVSLYMDVDVFGCALLLHINYIAHFFRSMKQSILYKTLYL